MIIVCLATGFEEIEALTPVDILRRGGFDVKTVAIGTETKIVTGSHGISVMADITERELSARSDFPACVEHLVLPGGMPGSRNLDESAQTDRFLSAAVEADAYLCAICAAPLVLGHRGLLMDRRATCYPSWEDSMLGAQAVPQGVVQDGKCITASGMGLAEPFALRLVQVLCGEEVARSIAKAIAPYRRKGMEKEWEN